MLAVQNMVVVEGVDMGVGSLKEMNQIYYLVKMVKLGPARTSKEMSSASDLAIKKKMETCYVPPRRGWHCILAPTMEMMMSEVALRETTCVAGSHLSGCSTSKAQAT